MKYISSTVAVVVALAASSASAELFDLRDLVSGNASLVHHWTFEGDTDPEQLENKKGSIDLTRVSTTGFAADWTAGYNGDGWAARTYRGSSGSVGGAYQTVSSFPPPSFGTVEYLFNPIDADKFAGHYLSSAAGTRFYAGVFNGPEAGVGFGNEGWPAPFGAYLSDSTTPDLEAGHWYYVAVPYQLQSSQFTFDVYLADLTEGQMNLTHAIVGATRAAPSSMGSSALGIGKQATSTNYFEGSVDEVALYNTQLSAATLQTHLDAIYVPEPGTMILLGMGGLLLLLGRRRRN